MATIQGIPNPGAFEFIEVSRRVDNSGSGTGPVWTIVYRGSKDALRLATYQWARIGAKYSINEDGPYSEATVIFSGPTLDPGEPLESATVPTAPETSTDVRYEFRTDYLDVSLFSLSSVTAEAESTGDPAFYKKTIEEAVRNGQKLEDVSPLGNLPLARKVFAKLCRGEDSFSVARISLSRIAMFSGKLGLPQVPQGIPPVYTPASFVSSWGLPFSVASMLPAIPVDPVTGQIMKPSGTIWGWKQTNYSTSLITKTNMVEQNISWTFAPYDTDIYPII